MPESPAASRGFSRPPEASPARLYLRPTGIERGAGAGLPLAGGDLRFQTCEAIWWRADGAIESGEGPIAEVEAWARGRRLAGEFADRMDALSAPRPPFAGLAMDRPRIMGILNLTPDSFSDGGDFTEPKAAVERGLALARAGAAIIDVGGESTRPDAEPVAVEEEIARVVPALEGLRGADAALSVDTRKAAVMRAALAAGAGVLNDITGLAGEPDSLAVAAGSDASVVLAHMAGEPRTMRRSAVYGRVTLDVYDELEARLDACRAAGIEPARIAVDPGFGLGKTAAHNVQILRDLTLFHGLGCPLVIGASRKTFVSQVTRENRPKARLPSSLAAALAALDRGAQILRVHDVAETAQAVAVWEAVAGAGGPSEDR